MATNPDVFRAFVQGRQLSTGNLRTRLGSEGQHQRPHDEIQVMPLEGMSIELAHVRGNVPYQAQILHSNSARPCKLYSFGRLIGIRHTHVVRRAYMAGLTETTQDIDEEQPWLSQERVDAETTSVREERVTRLYMREQLPRRYDHSAEERRSLRHINGFYRWLSIIYQHEERDRYIGEDYITEWDDYIFNLLRADYVWQPGNAEWTQALYTMPLWVDWDHPFWTGSRSWQMQLEDNEGHPLDAWNPWAEVPLIGEALSSMEARSGNQALHIPEQAQDWLVDNAGGRFLLHRIHESAGNS